MKRLPDNGIIFFLFWVSKGPSLLIGMINTFLSNVVEVDKASKQNGERERERELGKMSTAIKHCLLPTMGSINVQKKVDLENEKTQKLVTSFEIKIQKK